MGPRCLDDAGSRSNPIVKLCGESSDRIPKRLPPVVRLNLESGGEIQRSAAIIASSVRYDGGTDEQGNPIEVVSRLKDTVMAAADRQRRDPLSFISNREVFGDLIDNEQYVTVLRNVAEARRGRLLKTG
jgi:mannitol 2-dehydrogenase